MNKRDWCELAVFVFGLFLLYEALETLVTFSPVVINMFLGHDSFGRNGSGVILWMSLAMWPLKAACYAAAGAWLLSRPKAIEKLISRQVGGNDIER